MRVLGIESSCDDLAVCLFEGPDHVLASRVASQEKIHSRYGGIVPEIASREHLSSISPLIQALLEQLPEEKRKIEGIAVTHTPGLIGSLLVGVNFARGLSLAWQIPWIGVHHLEGHLMSAFLEEQKPKFPFIGLVVSGGHTNLYYVEDWGKYRCLGTTVDDAAGEAYDKVAKLFGLGYPGGPVLDRLAQKGDSEAVKFTLPKVKKGGFFTSFSGVKTAAREHFERLELNQLTTLQSIEENIDALNLIASFQNIVVRILSRLLLKASEELRCSRWVLAGGVACNSGLRKGLTKLSEKKGFELFIPQPKFCTDNAAMIALVGEHYLSTGKTSPLSLNAIAT